MVTFSRCSIAAALFSAFALAPLSDAGAASVTTLSDGVLKACLYTDGSPVSKQYDNGSWTGWDVDFLTGFAEAHGLKFEPVAIDEFGVIWNKPGEGSCDVSGGGVTYTAERAESTPDAIWSDPYFATKRSFVVREGDRESLKSVTDLANRTLLLWPNSTGTLDVRRRIEKSDVANVTIKEPGTALDGLRMVRDGQAFALDEDLTFARDLVARYPGLAVAWIHPMMSADGREADEVYAYIVRKADVGLVAALNTYIAENRDNYGWPQ